MNNLVNNYSIASENELAEILSHYESDFVLSIVEEAIKNCCNNPSGLPVPNVVEMWEANFNAILDTYGEEADEIRQVRNETYKEIIERLCEEYNLNFTISDDVDVYIAAFHLYNFFISNIANNIINFFATYIYNNRNDLYANLDISSIRKTREVQPNYAKRTIKSDEALIGIVNNIDVVVSNIMCMDFDFVDVLETVYPQGYYSIIQYLTSIVSPKDGSFFNRFCSYLKGPNRSMLLIMIKFALQRIFEGECASNDNEDNIENIVVKNN